MRTPPTFQRFALWIAQHYSTIFLICIFPALPSLIAYLFLSEPAQKLTGGLQAVFALLAVTFAVPHILFIPRGERVSRLLEFWPIAILRLLVFAVAMTVLIFMVLHSAFAWAHEVRVFVAAFSQNGP